MGTAINKIIINTLILKLFIFTKKKKKSSGYLKNQSKIYKKIK